MTTINNNYSINYSKKDYNNLFRDYVSLAAEEGLINNDPEYLGRVFRGDSGVLGNVILLEFGVHSKILRETYQNLTHIYESGDLKKATGKELDILLEPYISRQPHQHSHTQICLKRKKPYKDPIIVDEGTVFETHSGLKFQTLKEYTLNSDTEAVMVMAECTTPGQVGNIPPTTFKKSGIEGIKEAYSIRTAIGGCETEDDESYRQRAQKWRTINTKGTYSAVEDAISGVGGVMGYYIQPLWDGPGTTRIIIDPPDIKVLEDVKKAVGVVIPIDLDITYQHVNLEPLELELKVNIELKKSSQYDIETIRMEIEERLKSYVEGGPNLDGILESGLGLGEDFIPSRAIAYLINSMPLLLNVEIHKPSGKICIRPDQKAIIKKITIKTQ